MIIEKTINRTIKILKKIKSKIVHITLVGVVLVLMEMLFHLFGVETKNYMIFSSNIHWAIVLVLISIHFVNLESKPSQAIKRLEEERGKKSFEPYLPSLIRILFYFILIYFYLDLRSPNGEILFGEGERVLMVGHDAVLRVMSLDKFYMYKHYQSIVGLFFLLLIYIDMLLPSAYFVRRDCE